MSSLLESKTDWNAPFHHLAVFDPECEKDIPAVFDHTWKNKTKRTTPWTRVSIAVP